MDECNVDDCIKRNNANVGRSTEYRGEPCCWNSHSIPCIFQSFLYLSGYFNTLMYHLCAIIGLPSSFYTNKINLPILVHDFILKRTKKQIGMNIANLSNHIDFVDWKNKEEMIFFKNALMMLLPI